MKPLVSVIMPILNQERYLVDATPMRQRLPPGQKRQRPCAPVDHYSHKLKCPRRKWSRLFVCSLAIAAPLLAILIGSSWPLDPARMAEGRANAKDGGGPALALRQQGRCMSVGIDTINRFLQPPRRKVAIRRDDDAFVIAFQQDLIAPRSPDANALRKARHFLQWAIVSDTVPEAKDPAYR